MASLPETILLQTQDYPLGDRRFSTSSSRSCSGSSTPSGRTSSLARPWGLRPVPRLRRRGPSSRVTTAQSDDPTVLAAALADTREDLARCICAASDAAPLPFAPLATRQIGTSAAEDSAQVAVADDGSAYLAGATSGSETRSAGDKTKDGLVGGLGRCYRSNRKRLTSRARRVRPWRPRSSGTCARHGRCCLIQLWTAATGAIPPRPLPGGMLPW
jgi:hypothetical protein